MTLHRHWIRRLLVPGSLAFIAGVTGFVIGYFVARDSSRGMLPEASEKRDVLSGGVIRSDDDSTSSHAQSNSHDGGELKARLIASARNRQVWDFELSDLKSLGSYIPQISDRQVPSPPAATRSIKEEAVKILLP